MSRRALLILMIVGFVVLPCVQPTAADPAPEEPKWQVKETGQGAIKWNPKTGESFLLTGDKEKTWQPVKHGEGDDGWWYNPLVSMKIGDTEFIVELFEDIVPNTVANFLSLVDEGFYNKECSIYRVEKGMTLALIQGGRGWTHEHAYGIKNEAMDNTRYHLKNVHGTISMARTQALHSAATEFFVNLMDHPKLDNKEDPWCVFGQVVAPVDKLDDVKKNAKISDVRIVRKRGHDYVPIVTYAGEADSVRKR